MLCRLFCKKSFKRRKRAARWEGGKCVSLLLSLSWVMKPYSWVWGMVQIELRTDKKSQWLSKLLMEQAFLALVNLTMVVDAADMSSLFRSFSVFPGLLRLCTHLIFTLFSGSFPSVSFLAPSHPQFFITTKEVVVRAGCTALSDQWAPSSMPLWTASLAHLGISFNISCTELSLATLSKYRCSTILL